jgi:ferredoxin-type protein NapH
MEHDMVKNKQAGFMGYFPLILMNVAVYTVASLIFNFILEIKSAVPVFIFFGIVQILSMLLFVALPLKRKHIARKISMILIGGTLLFLAGILGKQNFQIEGLLFLIFGGVFGGPAIHFIMKTAGTLFTGRSWCSWGCWTAVVLDFLPYKKSTAWRNNALPKIRYIHFVLSVLLVGVLYAVLGYTLAEGSAETAQGGVANNHPVYWFVAGNGLYYLAGIMLAVKMKDNRAFCKYLCPVAVILKLSGIFSFLRIKGETPKCGGCKKCEESCPASIKVHSYIEKGERVASTECMMCLNCVAACPEGNLKTSLGVDIAGRERLIGR